MKSLMYKIVVVFIIQYFLVSCVPIGPGSRLYKPISDREQWVYNSASKSIYPDDVREDTKKFGDSLLVWAGIIKNYTVNKLENKTELELLIEHHYYDWIEDYGMQREKIFLSPRGEGLFKTKWYLNKDVDLKNVDNFSKKGNMAIVYGKPIEMQDDSTIVLECIYLRGIDKLWYRTDVMDYGRSGDY